MATSDSEDFESADEWDGGTEILKQEVVQDITSVKSDLKVVLVPEEPNCSASGDDDKKGEVLIAKSIENKPYVEENKLQMDAMNISDELSKEHEVVQKTSLSEVHEVSEEHAKEYYSTLVKQEKDKPISKKCTENEKIKLPQTQSKGDAAVGVNLSGEKPLLKDNEDGGTQLPQLFAVKDNASVVTEGSSKPLSKSSSETLDLNSKVISLDSSVEENTVVEAETDGWDCEDGDLNDDIIEESNTNGNMEAVLDKLSESVKNDKLNSESASSWGSWGSWGVTSLLSTATESVSTITNHVSQGLSTVLETGLGVPDPEELVKQEMEEEKKILTAMEGKNELPFEEKKEEDSGGLFGFGRVISGVSSITKLVEIPITKVVSGGLDTLETIGKKTMEVLQDGDPGLRKKRAIFSDNVVLSQILREAKEKAEQEDRALRNTEEARKVHFETLFDDYHGLVHLEALEMLSKQCNIKLQSVLLNTPTLDIAELQESITEIKELCQLPDEEDAEGASFETLEVKLADIGKGLGVPVANEKLIKTWQEIHQWLQSCKQSPASKETEENVHDSPLSVREIHEKAIGTLARLTAEAVEQFHKTAEMLLVHENRKPFEEAKILLDMTSVFSLQVSTAATVFSENLNISLEYADNPDAVNSQITNIFLEAANSSSYIQEAFQLLVPVLQIGIISS